MRDGDGSIANFYTPYAVAVDAAGNVFVADYNNHRIRKIDTTGNVTTIAGNGIAGMANGPAHTASFNAPTGIAVDAFGNVFVADYNNHRIRKIDTTGNVTTYAGTGTLGYVNGDALTTARLRNPHGLATDTQGNLYIAEYGNSVIRKVDTLGNVTTFAGTNTAGFLDGPAATAQFNYPRGLVVASNGDVYVADTNNHRIRKIDTTGNVTTIAGIGTAGNTNGIGSSARFYYPYDLAVTSAGYLYVADNNYNSIRRVHLNGTTYDVILYAGGSSSTGDFIDANGTAARFNTPTGIKSDSSGFLYIADSENHRIRKIDLQAKVTTYAGRGFFRGFTNGSSTLARFNNPQGMAYDSSGNLYIADTGNHVIRRVDAITGNVSTFVGTGTAGFFDGPRLQARLNSPTALVFDASGNLFIADSSNYRIRKLDTNGDVTTFAGGTSSGVTDGSLTNARFSSSVTHLLFDNVGNLYVCDSSNHRIRMITPAGVVSTLAGTTGGFLDGIGTGARLYYPRALAIGPNGNLYVADQYNDRIRMVNLGVTNFAQVTTVAGGTAGLIDGPAATARFRDPGGLAFDANGNLFIGERTNYRLRKLDTTGNVTSVGGDSRAGFRDGIDVNAFLNYPLHLIFAPNGDLLFTDYTNAVIRRLR